MNPDSGGGQLPGGPLDFRPPGPVYCFEHQAMACTWGLLIAGQSPAYAAQAARAAFAEVDRTEQELSRFVPTSDIARINALRAGESVLIGADALECLDLAARVHADTNGAFDVAVGALVGSVPAEATKRRSGEATKEDSCHAPTLSRYRVPASGASAPVGMHLLHIDRATRRVGVETDGLIVDLGGIGKGYAIDQAIGILRDWSIQAALLHAGQSTVYALGHPPDEPEWIVWIRDPRAPASSLGQTRLTERALSGSGAHLHGPHIVDPRTRRPADQAVAAWAVAPSAALADALSTAFMVMSAGEVAKYCDRHLEVAGLVLPAGAPERQPRCFGEIPGWKPTSANGWSRLR